MSSSNSNSRNKNKRNNPRKEDKPATAASITDKDPTKIEAGNAGDSSSNSNSSAGVVKWLYPGAPGTTETSSSEVNMSSSNKEQQQQPGAATPEDDPEEMQAKTSSSSGAVTTTGGPDGEDDDGGSMAGGEELPADGAGNAKGALQDDLSQKVTASANYLGSFLSSAWTKTAKTANDATNNSTTFLSSAFTKVTGSTSAKTSPKDEGPKSVTDAVTADSPNEEQSPSSTQEQPEHKSAAASAAMTASTLFSSAFNSFGFSATKTHQEDKAAADGEDKQEGSPTDGADGEGDNKVSENGSAKSGGFGSISGIGVGFTSAFSSLGKVAADATQTIKEKVGTKNMISEFNKEQDSFIKSKGGASSVDVGVAPWVGYQGEEELKTKILSLSEDKRTFVRAPPQGVTFDFEYSSVAATAMALLQEDEKLQKMRYDLVPKTVKEEEFWRNYFYRVSLIKQSFELKDLERSEKDNKKKKESTAAVNSKTTSSAAALSEDVDMGHDNDDEFVSDSYQASTSDIAEVNETMKKLGVVGGGDANNAEEWEAELEGELNEFEVVNNKEDNPEWENQIQEMLDAEESLK